MAWPVDVRKSDLRIDTFASGGPGGQHQNKTASGVRITHLPTGLSAECRSHREQPRNKAEAFRKLAAMLVPLMRLAAKGEPIERPREMERIRTYHVPDQRVTDHRLQGQRWTPSSVLDGDGLADLIEELKLMGI